MASEDPFDELLQLENEFYKEGYEAGVADSAYAGLVEGKVFGIEKGYEKALELGRIHGRALVWSRRMATAEADTETETAANDGEVAASASQDLAVEAVVQAMPKLPNNARLRKHINGLVALTDPGSLPRDNSDDSVSELDGRIVKARAKVKMIATMVGESVVAANASTGQPAAGGIEDSTGLDARR